MVTQVLAALDNITIASDFVPISPERSCRYRHGHFAVKGMPFTAELSGSANNQGEAEGSKRPVIIFLFPGHIDQNLRLQHYSYIGARWSKKGVAYNTGLSDLERYLWERGRSLVDFVVISFSVVGDSRTW